MRVVLIDQARMTSTRLPGKVLKPVMEKPLLAFQLERLLRAGRVDACVVATTRNQTDDPIVALCESMGVAVFRGDERDVLDRYYQAARQFRADCVVRVTSDCPLIDPTIVDRVVRTFVDADGRYDYVSNTRERTFPRGMDTEVFSMAALEAAWREAHREYEREHVTPFIYQHPDRFSIFNVPSGRELGMHRWTVDTPEDFDLIKRMLEAVYPGKPRFGMDDLLALFDRHPEWMAINSHIHQKELGQ